MDRSILSNWAAVVLSIAVAAFAGVCCLLLATVVLRSYGGALFLATPTICGAVAALVYSANGPQPASIWGSLGIAFLACATVLSLFLFFGLEGLLCLAMAVPLVMPAYLIGGLIGFAIAVYLRRRASYGIAAITLMAAAPALMAIESTHAVHRSVTTRVIIEAPIEAVWAEVIAFSPIPPPKDTWFRLGIAYPTHATIEGEGVGAVRYCHFSTGTFVEPITHWEENRRLAFDVTEQPDPMIELSPYGAIHPPHLEWAVISERGEFLLEDLGDGRVALIGTTWYHTVMKPEPYWGWIADNMIERIHLRVLEHIRDQAAEAR